MNDFFERVMEAQREAFKNQIAANTILINERLVKVKPFIFGSSLIPAMICGLEVKITDDLPDNVSFAVAEAAQTEREKLIAKTSAETAKEIYDFARDFFEWDEEGFCTCLADLLKQEYGIEVQK